VWGSLYVTLTGAITATALLSPAYALQLDTTKYARVVEQAEAIALQAAQKATVADAIGVAAVAASPVSLGVKGVASALAIGGPLGLTLWQTYYSGSDLATLAVNRPPGTWTTSGGPYQG